MKIRKRNHHSEPARKTPSSAFAQSGLRWWADPAGNLLVRTPSGNVETIPSSSRCDALAVDICFAAVLSRLTA